jgi:hypothetical protein
VSDPAQEPDDLLGFLAEDGSRRQDPDEHPAPEILTAYHAGELSPEEEEQFQEHLAVCGQCTELLLELDSFLEPPPIQIVEPVGDYEVVDWRKLRKGLGGNFGEKDLGRPERRSSLASVWGGYALAALLVISVGLGIANVELFREIRKPQPIRTVQTLTAQGSTRGDGTKEGEPVVLPANITLPLPTETPSSLYQVEIIPDGSQRPEWSLDVPQDKGDLNVHLPAKALSPGTYTVQVAPLSQGRPGPVVWRYALDIVP